MHRTTRVFAITMLAAGLALAQGERSAEVQLKAAIHKEQVEGDLKTAIRLYQSIVEKHSANREVAARALLQMGQCYEKLGQADARKVYERLVREFADQGDLVKEAQTRLAALTAPEAKPKFTKIRIPTKLPGLTEFALSPDGAQLAYVSDGSVWVVPTHGASHPEIAGPPRRISDRTQPWMRNYGIVWSRDAKWIALNVLEKLPAGGTEPAIYLVPSAGGQPTKMPLELKNYVIDYWDPRLSLSPDAARLAYTTWRKGEDARQRSVYIAPTQGGTAQRLSQPITQQPEFSPDGKMVAYVGLLKVEGRPPESPLGRQVWVAQVAGGKPRLVYELPGAGRLRSPTWSPDGRMLAFLVCPETDQAKHLVFVPINMDGGPGGSPVQIDLPQETDFYLSGWGTDNKIGLVFRTLEVTALYVVPASGGKAVQMTPKEGWMPSWTPDGKWIYFGGSNLEVRASVEFISAAGGKVTRIPLRGPHQVQIAYPTGGISVSPDGKKILFNGVFWPAPVESLFYLFTVPIEGGEVVEISTGMSWASQPCWSPDGRAIGFVGSEEVRKNVWVSNIYTVPAEGGKARQVTSLEDKVINARIAWSPDGKHIAYYSEDDALKLAPRDGGSSKVLLEGLKGYRRHSGLAFSPDGKNLAYVNQNKIWRLNLETGKSEEVQTGLDAIHTQLAWSPDGSAIAFSALQGGEPELWLMSDFLPLLRPKR